MNVLTQEFRYQATYHREPVDQQIACVSSGTIASITGLARYDDIDAYRLAWWQWAREHGEPNETWQDNHARYTANGAA